MIKLTDQSLTGGDVVTYKRSVAQGFSVKPVIRHPALTPICMGRSTMSLMFWRRYPTGRSSPHALPSDKTGSELKLSHSDLEESPSSQGETHYLSPT
jgi:hypothetical protein